MISLCRSGVAYAARLIVFLKASGAKGTVDFYKCAKHSTSIDVAIDHTIFTNNEAERAAIAAERAKRDLGDPV